jgi:hypothetical protein
MGPHFDWTGWHSDGGLRLSSFKSLGEVVGHDEALRVSGDMDRAFALPEDREKVDVESVRLMEYSKRFDWRRTSERTSAHYENLLG